MIELNLDGLVGPTHLFQGLSFGNLASTAHEGIPSSPKKAAIEGLNKMWLLAKQGVRQGVLPPQRRPRVDFLRQAGFTGSDKEVLVQAYKENPSLLAIASSSSSMWAANSATVSNVLGKVHITPANLSRMPHRALEAEETAAALKLIFPSFIHHPKLPSNLPDEGAANHMRLFSGKKSVEIFVYGMRLLEKRELRFPARYPLESAQAIARLHGLNPSETFFLRQSEEAINAGVFHNDVVATSFENFLLFHEKAFADKEPFLEELLKKAPYTHFYEVKMDQLTLDEAIATYLFNSQIVRTESGKRLFLAPEECQKSARALATLNDIAAKGLIDEIAFVSLSESMHNGGGPACLRLRIPLNEKGFTQVNPKYLLDERLYEKLVKWIETHYRETLTLADLPFLLEESDKAIHDLYNLLT